MVRSAAVLMGLLMLSGCATLSEDQCLAGDWTRIGFQDGSKGRGLSIFDKHTEACAEYGIAPQKSAWLTGREQGLRVYCTPNNAYKIGRRGTQIAPYCRPDEEIAMAPAYEHGRRYYEISRDIAELRREEDRLIDEAANAGDGEGGVRLARSLRGSLSFLRLDILRLETRLIRYSTWP